MQELRERILEQSHEYKTGKLAREYFKKSGIEISTLQTSHFYQLSELIQIEIDKLLADGSYQMIKELKVKDRIKNNKRIAELRISGSYFSNRQGITFEKISGWIGFCGEMSGCNRIPFIVGFVKWVDTLTQKT